MPHMKVLVVALLLLATNGPAIAQSRRPVVFSIQSQTVTLTMRSRPPDETSQSVINARVTYTITSANASDTLTGTLTVTFPGDPKKKREPAKRPPIALHPSFSQVNVAASFRKQTGCPLIRIEIGPLELSLDGRPVEIRPFDLVIVETKDEMSQLLCFWTKQINTAGPRRGIVAKINRLISGDEQAQ